MAVSLAAKPEPVTVNDVPGFPLFPLRETVGVTVKRASRSDPEPETRTGYVPFGDEGMAKVVVQEPCELAAAEATIAVPKLMEMPL
jgi:hypothetical protein